jgi:hypothetical protein
MMRGSLTLLAIGGGLAYRGLTGHCHVYEALGRDTAHGGADSDTETGTPHRVILSE